MYTALLFKLCSMVTHIYLYVIIMFTRHNLRNTYLKIPFIHFTCKKTFSKKKKCFYCFAINRYNCGFDIHIYPEYLYSVQTMFSVYLIYSIN